MGEYYDARLQLKLTEELKGAYTGLCKARNVTVSEKLREFMAKELADALQDERQFKAVHMVGVKKTDRPQDENVDKCENTADMFTGDSP
jgi:hypothetical protein